MKRVIVPVLILVVLIAAYLFIQNSKTKSVTQERISNFLNLSAADVSHFIIEQPGSILDFSRAEVGWNVMVDSVACRADSVLVNEIVAMCTNIEVGEVESDNPKKQGLYQVDGLTGTRITFYNNQDELSSVIVGRNSQGYNYSYVRKPSSNLVYSGKGVKGALLSRPVANFRDKNIIQVDTSTLVSVAFEFRDESFTLKRADSLWSLSALESSVEQPVNSDTLELFKRQLVNLRADDFLSQSDSNFVIMNPPELIVTLKYKNGNSIKLSLIGGDNNKTRYFIRREGVNETYMIQYSKYGQLLRGSNNFL